MEKLAEDERYMKYLCEALGHQDRHVGFSDYSRGLMLPIERKSVEPLAAYTDPLHVSAKHQSLHHLVADSEWSDVAVLGRVRDWVMARLGRKSKFYWIVDDTGFPKKGTHSVGVARQYCGQLGKQDNCQVAVSLSLATERGSVPIDWRLYLPEKWAKDRRRRKKGGVPKEVKFLTKPEIALEQIGAAKAAGVPIGIVLADAGYGNETAWREVLGEMELEYCVGVQSVTTVWAAGTGPVPPKRKNKIGRPPTRWQRVTGTTPLSVKGLAETLTPQRWHNSWGQVFTLDNLSLVSYIFVPWLARCELNTTERCTMSLLGGMSARRFLGTLPTASRFSLLFSKWPGAFIGSATLTV